MADWLKNAVFYEIYPQTFNDTNADGIGDFQGIIEKLDYIKDMGYTDLWINPCFKSPFYDAGYDVEDFYTVAPRYGTNEDLKRLFGEAHKRGMHVLLDLVAGHTAVTCDWLKQSMKNEKNEYSDRYIWTESVWQHPNDIEDISGWLRGFSPRNGSCALNYFTTQPALNYGFAKVTEPWMQPVDAEGPMATREELVNIIKFWLKLGCDGFRVDMAFSLVKADPDKVETTKLWKDVLGRVKAEFPDSAFIPEWGEVEKSLGAGFDMDFLMFVGPSNYNDLFRCDNPYFRQDGKGDATKFFKYFLSRREMTRDMGYMCLPAGNHDMARITHWLDETELRLAYAFIFSMPCIPFMYNGDEIGMRYIDGMDSVEGAYERTGNRLPMQWDDTLNNGFSAATPDLLYIQPDPEANGNNVKAQMEDEGSLWNFIKNLITLRKATPALQESTEFEMISGDEQVYPLVYIRYDNEKKILVSINPTDKEQSCKADVNLGEVMFEYNGKPKYGDGTLTVPPCSASYIVIE